MANNFLRDSKQDFRSQSYSSRFYNQEEKEKFEQSRNKNEFMIP